MSAKVFCMASAKGGSGKTSLCATFATFLAQLGRKVLLVDSDFATSGLTLLYLKEVKVQSELIRSKARPAAGLADAIRLKAAPSIVALSEGLDLLPATFDLQQGLTSPDESTAAMFHELLAPLRETYDFILIDAQAGADDMGQISMSRRVSDEVVIVSEYDPMSAAGVERLKAILRDDLTYERTWVLLNKILPEFARSFSDFMEVAKYLNPIPWDASVVRAYARRRLAIDTETGNEHTVAVLHTLRGLCGEAIQKDLEAWVLTRAATIRQPLEDQYADAEREMAFLLKRKVDIERRRKLSRVFSALGFAVATGVATVIAYGKISTSGSIPNGLLISLGVVALVGVVILFLSDGSEVLLRVLGIRSGVDREVEEIRYDRQFEILRERLKRLELLRTLDSETLLGRPEMVREAQNPWRDRAR
jgi:MinD-like ATPase involved in chromosome partitioning or flagellar assembly